jgi:hypothetical protein
MLTGVDPIPLRVLPCIPRSVQNSTALGAIVGFRFRRTVKLFPGLRLNFSLSGISATVGVRGLGVTLSKSGTYLNMGLPGTGLSYRTRLSTNRTFSPYLKSRFKWYSQSAETEDTETPTVFSSESFESAPTEALTSATLDEFKEMISHLFANKENICKLISEVQTERENIERRIRGWQGLFWAIFKPSRMDEEQNKVEQLNGFISDLNGSLTNCAIDADFDADSEIRNAYTRLSQHFQQLCNCQAIWDVTRQKVVDPQTTKSQANALLLRHIVKFDFTPVDFIKSEKPPLHMANANGEALYIYPGFALVLRSTKEFALIDLIELSLTVSAIQFTEEGAIPGDTTVIQERWAKTRSDGHRDLRYRHNYAINIVKYGKLHIESAGGLNEMYLFSNYDAVLHFYESFDEYIKLLRDRPNN